MTKAMERLLIGQPELILGSAAIGKGKWPDSDLLSANEDWYETRTFAVLKS
jgi:hypothetical protein